MSLSASRPKPRSEDTGDIIEFYQLVVRPTGSEWLVQAGIYKRSKVSCSVEVFGKGLRAAVAETCATIQRLEDEGWSQHALPHWGPR